MSSEMFEEVSMKAISGKLIFAEADKFKASLSDEEARRISKLYSDWSKELGERAKYFKKKDTFSAALEYRQMMMLKDLLKNQSYAIAGKVKDITVNGMLAVSKSVIGCNDKFLVDLGFSKVGVDMAYSSVSTDVVNALVNGKIYKGGWNLSKSIWGDQQKTLQELYGIVAKGAAQNMSAYDVSKLLEKYVDTSKAKQWNLRMDDGTYIYKRKVDYNAQRLVRTLNQHAYQQTMITAAKDNPFIKGIIWRANGSRVCDICADLDGQFFRWADVPMDHPNGMCTMEPAIDPDMEDKLARWVNSDAGTYPDIDEFASKLGYDED